MEKIITIDNLRNFAYCNNSICAQPIRGVALSFFGLGGKDMYDEDTEVGRMYAEKGILFLIPYYNPWSWMNRQTVDLVDELVDVLFQTYALPEDTPVISTGGSMGGLSALVYTAYASRTPAACVTNCPVCDLVYHFTERADLPRTLYSAFGTYPGTMDEAMATASPVPFVKKMPVSTAYTIFHCEQDKAVNKQKHSDRFVELLRQNHDVTYIAVPDRGHCDLPEDMKSLFYQKVFNAAKK